MIKQADVALIILVIGISLIVSFLVGNSLINTDKNQTAQVEIISPIASEFPTPSDKIFYEGSINPTVLIQIGDTQVDKQFIESTN